MNNNLVGSLRVFHWFCVLACGLMPIALAQGQPMRISLKDAVAKALAQNPDSQIANLQLAEVQQDAAISRARLLPKANLQTEQQMQRFNIESIIGQRLPGISQHIGPFQVVDSGVAFSTPIFDLTLWKGYGVAKERVLAAQSDRRIVREETALLVVSQYLAALRAAARVKAVQSRCGLAQALFQQADALRADGIATRVDMLRAEVRLKQEQQALLRAETDVKTTLYGLSRLLNVPDNQGISLDDEDQFFQTPDPQFEATLESAYANRPELSAQNHREAAAVLARSATAMRSAPSLSFQGMWGEQGRALSEMIPAYTYQFNLNIPLFTGGELTAERRRAALESAKVKQQTLDMHNRITEQVKTATAELESARNQVDVANQALQLAKEELDLTRGRFLAGVTDNIEVVAAQDSLATANDNQIDALFDFNKARAELAHALGQVEATYTRSR